MICIAEIYPLTFPEEKGADPRKALKFDFPDMHPLWKRVLINILYINLLEAPGCKLMHF